MNSPQVHLLWVVGAGLMFSGIVVNQTSGSIVYQMLVANGVLAFMAYLAFRGFLTENPRFLAARGKLLLCLWVMLVGALGISLSTILELFSTLFPASPVLFWGGGIACLGSVWAFVILIVISRPKPLSPNAG